MSECELCGLPTPDPPGTDAGVEGEFCCRGCLEVAKTLDAETTLILPPSHEFFRLLGTGEIEGTGAGRGAAAE